MKRHASLNRLYRLIWSRVQNGWIPVVELARRAGRGRCRALIALPFLAAGTALGAPEGGQVASGTGTIAQSGATTTVSQSSQNLSLTWQSFDVGAQETVNFEQPSPSAIAVNRIFDTNGSQILGRLNANGQVFLINPNGVLFGKGAQVNVGGLVASTLDIAGAGGDTKYFSGNGTGSVANHGEITAVDGGYVALLGNSVSNQGTINAPLGGVALGAGNAITLTFQNNSLLTMQVDESVLNSAADNGGLIRADGGMVVMNAGAKDALLASVVNNTGVIEARTVENRSGSIVLLGGMQAGTANVAGTLDASARDGGDGGFVETSAAHVKIADDVNVTTAAASGQTGSWLIDPVDFTIAASGGDMTGATLSGSLGSTDVIIESVNGGAGSSGDVNVNDVVEWSANNLTLSAANNINVNANMNASGSASLALEFGQAAAAAGNTSNVITNDAAINLPAGTTNFTTKLGSDGLVKAYTVITGLGDVGSTTTTDLQGVNGDLAANYALGADIDAAATATWDAGEGFMPLGNGTTQFTGTFDGLGHAISQLSINRVGTDYAGLFGYTNGGATIQNVGLLDSSVIGRNHVGGLVGFHASGTVSNSYFAGDVKRNSSNGDRIGGLVGRNAGTISDSFADANVGGSSHVGGLVGNNAGIIEGSYSVGSLHGSNRLGGLVGVNGGGGNITRSYSSVAVTSNFFLQDMFGGLVGQNAGDISESYANGVMVVNQNAAGGLVGSNSGAVTSSFWDVGTTGQGTSAGGTGMSTADMQTQENFTSATVANGNVDPGWDFADTWLFINEANAPLLAALMIDVTVTVDDVTKTYDGSVYSGSYSSAVDGHLPGNLIYTGSSQAAVNAGSYVIAASYANKQYVITAPVDGTLIIDRADLTVTTVDIGKTYDGGLSAVGKATVAGGSLFGTDSLSGGEFAFTNKNVGSGNKVVTVSDVAVNDGNGGNNYNLTYVGNTTSTITAADLTLASSDVSKVYDAGLSAAGSAVVTSGSLLGSDTLSGGSFAFTDKNIGDGDKTVTASGVTVNDGNNGGNYNLSYADNTSSTITAASLTVTGVDVSNRSYDGSLAAELSGTARVTALGSDTVSVDANGSGTFADKHVGTGKIVTVSGYGLGGPDAGNYLIVQPAGLTADITAANLTVSTSDVSKIYDAGLSAAGSATVISGSLFGSDSVSGGIFAFVDKNVGDGNKTVTTSAVTVTDGNSGSNYNVNYVDNTSSTISPASIAITGVSASDKQYDGTTAATLVGAATVAVFGSDSVTVTDTGLAVFSDPEIGADKPVAVGGYRLSGADAQNYLIVQPSGLIADITLAAVPLPVSGVASQVTSLLSSPPTSTRQMRVNLASATSTLAAGVNGPGEAGSSATHDGPAADGRVGPGELGSMVRVVNGGVNLSANWDAENE